MKQFLIGASLAAALAAPALAQVMSPTEYVAAAGASDLYERQSSQIVLQTTQDPRIRSFATMMISDHGRSTADVKAAADRSGVPAAPPMPTLLQAELIAELRAESGAARDATYVAQQRTAHDQALAVQKAYATDGTDHALKTAAAHVVPVVEHHIMLLKGM